MANDKREQGLGHDGLVLWTPFVEASRKIWGSLFDQISDEVRSHQYDLFKAGHAAATAEGIPQADGWVDVADRLPPDDAEVLVTINTAYNAERRSVFVQTQSHCDDEWETEDVIAWQPLPAPYQRQSSEGE